MLAAHETLFPELEAGNAETRTTGTVPSQEIRALIRERAIESIVDITEDQIQPASLDLRLGAVAYRVRASFLPGKGNKVRDKIDAFGMHQIDLTKGALLERGCVYIVPLMESLRLGKRLSAIASPKSSIGRLNVFTRLITDGGTEFDRVPEQYKGPLYAEITPRGFSVVVRQGSRLLQIRLKRGRPSYTDTEMRRLQDEQVLIAETELEAISGGLPIKVNLRGDPATGLIGYKARQHTNIIDVDKIDHYDPLEYWNPIHATGDDAMILTPDDFYILASEKAVNVPPDHAAEMVAYDTMVGEFRVHYAGFFDPGFGHAEAGGTGARAVLEVRSHEVPFVIEHGQTMGRLVYERLMAVPDKLYGAGIGSSYQRQGLALGKQFKKL